MPMHLLMRELQNRMFSVVGLVSALKQRDPSWHCHRDGFIIGDPHTSTEHGRVHVRWLTRSWEGSDRSAIDWPNGGISIAGYAVSFQTSPQLWHRLSSHLLHFHRSIFIPFHLNFSTYYKHIYSCRSFGNFYNIGSGHSVLTIGWLIQLRISYGSN